MPKILHDLANKLKAKGYPEDKAWAIATSQLQKSGKLPKKGSRSKVTSKGKGK